MFKKYFQKQRIFALLNDVSKLLYSQEFSFVDAYQRLNDKSNDLELLSAMHFVAFMDDPPTVKDARDIIKELEVARNELGENGMLDYKELLAKNVEKHWVVKLLQIQAAKIAHDEDPESYLGTIYISRKTLGRALTQKEEDKWRELINKLEDAKLEMKRIEQKAQEYLSGQVDSLDI